MTTKKGAKASKPKGKPATAAKAPAAKQVRSASGTAKARKASAPGKSRKSAEAAGEPPALWNLRLYVVGDSPRSRTALANLRRLCEQQLKDRYDIEVIDLTKRPDLAKADQILAVPTLIRKIPEPMKRVIGDLSNADRALLALDMEQR